MSDLANRLQRLRRPPEAPSGPSGDVEPGAFGLERLEREMLGESSPGDGEVLSLKERLERLVAVAAVKEKERRGPAPVPLEELVEGMRVENERGEFFLVETMVHLEVRHGDVPLSRVHTIGPSTVGVLTAEPELEGFDLRRAVFLDTETTGLAGGAGTAAFLIGVGWVDGDRFVVRQYFMRDYHEEAALLHALAEELARFDAWSPSTARCSTCRSSTRGSASIEDASRCPGPRTSIFSTPRGGSGRRGSSPAACSRSRSG